MDYGVTSMSAPLRRVAVRAPAPASDFAQAHWAQPLDVDLLIDQHAAFAGILQRLGCDVLELPPLEGLPDSCFTYDPAFTIGDGVIALRSAKAVRVGEGERLAADLAAAGIPTVASLSGSATADGGDMFWLDDDTLAESFSNSRRKDARNDVRWAAGRKRNDYLDWAVRKALRGYLAYKKQKQ